MPSSVQHTEHAFISVLNENLELHVELTCSSCVSVTFFMVVPISDFPQFKNIQVRLH